ncbi:MAG: hypothetical protein LBC29_04970 [Propionibacteriaceae bacterium]|jgi:hypothetical protein|nr:hypothetical protein [Propionibacteriaceae bacterium]
MGKVSKVGGALVVAALLVSSLVACAGEPVEAGQPTATAAVDTRGLTILDEPPQPYPEALRGAVELAAAVTTNYPDDFGRLIIDVEQGKVIIPAVSAAAIALAESSPEVIHKTLVEYSIPHFKEGDDGSWFTAPDHEPALSLVTLVPSPETLSVNALFETVQRVDALREDETLAAAEVISCGVGANGHIVLSVRYLTDELVTAIISQFGTDLVVLEVQPDFGPVELL